MSELKSKVILVGNIKIDKDYINVLSYTEQQMLSLCESNAIASKDDYSFIHHQKSMFTDFTYNQCLQANYIAFQNKDYSNKWFFAFIDEIEFKGESNTEIKFTVDVWSTFYESIISNAKPCLVTREHVNNDTIGLHTIPEDVDVGRVFCSDAQEDISLSQYGWIGILTTYDPAFDKDLSPVSVNNNILNASHLFLIEYNEYNFNNFNLFLYKCNKADKVGAIQNVFFVPSALVDRSQLIITTNSFIEDGTTYTYSYYKLPFSYEPKVLNQNINKNYNFTGITIKNNKCYCYPYNYLLATNNIGNQNIYKYEDFSTSNCQFKIQMAITPGISGRLLPTNYKGLADGDDDETIALAKYPTFSWITDAYINWLTQQAVNMPTQIVSGGISALGQLAGGNVVGSLTTVAGTMASAMGQFYKASLLPNTTNGQNTADVNFAAARNTITFKAMRCRNEYMQIIDNYFSRFGYKVNEIKVPNFTGRENWNYIEIGSNEILSYNSINNQFKDKINEIARRGITIWHNHNNVGNFNLSNNIE